ncbi:hypothetical protein [Trichocoleus sp. FACHB-262]|uniref:hypothetical protein n=1 Tax=Trichocoleus sp. FACHB-262 TaxID=2692869 RepID=UPI0016832CE7|nr:hypothetical protein [Trichocoleus sp. FACHB-262]MBD2124669.1 hypothetical protein [Trichocoleus sp. FACHB-262]
MNRQVSNESIAWEKQLEQLLAQNGYEEAMYCCQQELTANPTHKLPYWYLGLIYILKGDEIEAQAAWLTGMIEGDTKQIDLWTRELVNVLQVAAEHQEEIGEHHLAWVIRSHIKELDPNNINNLLCTIISSIRLGIFSLTETSTLAILGSLEELLRSENTNIESHLLLQVFQELAAYDVVDRRLIQLAKTCLEYLRKYECFVDTFLFASQIVSNEPQKIEKQPSERKYSYLDEEKLISKFIEKLNPKHKYCVDIAASDGITMSNTYFLFRQGWSGLAVECDSQKFANLALAYREFDSTSLSKCFVTPENVVELLKSHQVPQDFGFLSFDIDGYDYFVLERMLEEFRPSLICAEINEKIPPPIKFTVLWKPDYVWTNDHFYGQSISQLALLCERYDYALVELHYNNAFLIPKELSPVPSLTPELAYEIGYLNKPDRRDKFPWNSNVEKILSLEPVDALEFTNNLFSKYQGKFTCNL